METPSPNSLLKLQDPFPRLYSFKHDGDCDSNFEDIIFLGIAPTVATGLKDDHKMLKVHLYHQEFITVINSWYRAPKQESKTFEISLMT